MMGSLLIALCFLLASPVAAETEQLTAKDLASSRNDDSLRWRAGLQLDGGILVPAPAPDVGITARVGIQRSRVGFLLELGALGAFASDTSDPADSQVSLLAMGHLTPTVEYDVTNRAFVSGGVMLGAGLRTYSKHSVDASGAVSTESGGSETVNVINFMPGLDVRAGWRFGAGAHHLTVALDLKLIAAAGHQGSASVAADGRVVSASDKSQLVVAATPMLVVGYEFKR